MRVVTTDDLYTNEELDVADTLERIHRAGIYIRDQAIRLMQLYPGIWGDNVDNWRELLEQQDHN